MGVRYPCDTYMLPSIEKLRRQPKPVRDRYAMLIAFGVTLCITVVWGINTSVQFSNLLSGSSPVQQTAAAGTNIFSQFKQFWHNPATTKTPPATTTVNKTPAAVATHAWSSTTKLDVGSLLSGTGTTPTNQEVILIGTTSATTTATDTVLQ